MEQEFLLLQSITLDDFDSYVKEEACIQVDDEGEGVTYCIDVLWYHLYEMKIPDTSKSKSAVFSFCKMAGEQSIALLTLEFEGQGAQITHKFLTCFYCHIILSLGCYVKQALNYKHRHQDRYLCKKNCKASIK